MKLNKSTKTMIVVFVLSVIVPIFIDGGAVIDTLFTFLESKNGLIGVFLSLYLLSFFLLAYLKPELLNQGVFPIVISSWGMGMILFVLFVVMFFVLVLSVYATKYYVPAIILGILLFARFKKRNENLILKGDEK